MSIGLLSNCEKVKLPTEFNVVTDDAIDPILEWLESIGKRDIDWYYSTSQHAFFFLREEDAVIFRLKFGL